VGVLVICVLVFTVFSIVGPVFFVLFRSCFVCIDVRITASDKSIAVNNNNNNNLLKLSNSKPMLSSVTLQASTFLRKYVQVTEPESCFFWRVIKYPPNCK
jgi:hypothetical protein